MVCNRRFLGAITICFAAALYFILPFRAAATSAKGTCGENLTWELSRGTLVISGTGDMYDYTTGNKAPWYSFGGSGAVIKSIVIRLGVTSIGDYAFYGLGGSIDVSIPSSVKEIGEGAFYFSCITSMDIPDGVEKIDDYAFYQCRCLTEVTIPASVTKIEGTPFIFCDKLSQINVDNKNTTYMSDGGALIDTVNRKLLHYPANKARTSYMIPEGIVIIGSSAFRGQKYLTEVIIPDSVTTLEKYAFSQCKSLKSITLPIGLEYLDQFVFSECTELSGITFEGAPPAFYGDGSYLSKQFGSVKATVYYPDLETWNETVRLNYGGTLTWVEYAHDHIEKKVEGVDPTCDEVGRTESSYCVLCKSDILIAEELAPLGHDEEILPLIYPNLESAGLTEGRYCTRCETVLVAQDVIPAAETKCSIYAEEAGDGQTTVIIRNNDTVTQDVILIVARYSGQGQMKNCVIEDLTIDALDGTSRKAELFDSAFLNIFVIDRNTWSPLCKNQIVG